MMPIYVWWTQRLKVFSSLAFLVLCLSTFAHYVSTTCACAALVLYLSRADRYICTLHSEALAGLDPRDAMEEASN